MKNLRYLNIFTILIIYTLLMFYIGWNGWVWLHAVFGWESWGYYAFIVAFISYAYILVQVFKFLLISANDRFDLVCGHTICTYVVAIS